MHDALPVIYVRRVCAGTPVHYEQTVKEEDAASEQVGVDAVSVCAYTGTA